MTEAVRSLSDFRIDMKLDADDMYDEFEAGGPLWLIKRVLLQATSLKVLHIRTNISEHNNFDALEQPISLLPLSELRLAGLKIYDTTLADILQNLGSTLRFLSISGCQIYGSWKQVLLRIQQHALQLDYLHINGSKRTWMEDAVEYKGTESVRLGLEKLLRARDDFGNESEDE